MFCNSKILKLRGFSPSSSIICVIILGNPYPTITNNNKAKRSLCCTLFDGLVSSLGLPITNIEIEDDSKHSLIHLYHYTTLLFPSKHIYYLSHYYHIVQYTFSFNESKLGNLNDFTVYYSLSIDASI